MQFKCKICNTELALDKCQVFASKCFVNQVELIRYKCTTCGVIFGTLDMINGTTTQIKNYYEDLDKRYKEGDDWGCEDADFFYLNPKPGGLYLNFGCGNTSTAIPKLRSKGWNLIGYEPYLPNVNPNIIKTKDELAKYKFDGILSNNLIEHLQDPVQDFLFMKSLLKDKTGLMCHSTACYDYKYEYSMFHLYFFVDKSVDYLCANSGFKVKQIIRKPGTEYVNYIYEQI